MENVNTKKCNLRKIGSVKLLYWASEILVGRLFVVGHQQRTNSWTCSGHRRILAM